MELEEGHRKVVDCFKTDPGSPLESTHKARRTVVQRDVDTAQPTQSASSWSHFLNSTTVEALAVTRHSSASSSRMGGDRWYPCCPCQQPSLNITCFIQKRWGGRTRWRNRTTSVKLRGQKKCSTQSLAGTQAQGRGSSRKLSRCLTVCSRLIKRKIRQSGNQPTGNAALHLPGEHQ